MALMAFPVMAEPKIILHPDLGEQTFDTFYLNQIFAMQVRKWPNGESIQVFTLPSQSKLHRDFAINTLRIQTHQLDRIWKRMLFTGTGKAPTVVSTEAEMLEVVRTTPGAIGYLGGETSADGVISIGGPQ